MAARSLPEKVVAHLQAAIQLSNNRVYLRLLDQAEGLIALNLPSAASIMTGALLESFLEDCSWKPVPENEEQIVEWRNMRDAAAHSNSPQPTIDQATQMIRGVRRLLTSDPQFREDTQSRQQGSGKSSQVRGKYRFVPTTSTSFIERKNDELRLEHQ